MDSLIAFATARSHAAVRCAPRTIRSEKGFTSLRLVHIQQRVDRFHLDDDPVLHKKIKSVVSRDRTLSFTVPSPEAERLFLDSFGSTNTRFGRSPNALRASLAGCYGQMPPEYAAGPGRSTDK